jgi:demethylmacrocin O-methyltransferase
MDMEMHVLDLLREAAVRTVKPRVRDEIWQSLRRLEPSKRRRMRQKALLRTPSNAPVAGQRPKGQVRASAVEKLPPLSERDLPSLARHFGTDKWGTHRYAQRYENHFARLKNEDFTLLEIGIGGYAREKQGGASLRMWKAFFPKAHIIGLDINDKSFVAEPRIQPYQGSQTNEPLLKTIVESAQNLLIVIDDGSHRPEHVRETFRILFPLLPDGALYAIEDTQTSYWPRWGGSLDPQDDDSTTMGLVKGLIDGLNYEEWSDSDYIPSYTDLNVVAVHCYHNLVIIEKGPNREGTNRNPKTWKG